MCRLWSVGCGVVCAGSQCGVQGVGWCVQAASVECRVWGGVWGGVCRQLASVECRVWSVGCRQPVWSAGCGVVCAGC